MAQFTLNHVAVHLVDRKRPEGPQFSQGEISLQPPAFSDDEKKTVEEFFFDHLGAIWKAPDSPRTRFATFEKNSTLAQIYQGLRRVPGEFFARSKDMARELHRVSQKKSTSPGLLLALWVTESQTPDEQFLVLIKLDPEKAERIVYRADQANRVLLGLAVEQIERALPEVSDRVLKWAVIPHPGRRTGLKIRDQEGTPDPAQYFVDFLGCRLSRTVTEDLGDTIGAVEETLTRQLDERTARSAAPLVFGMLKELDQVTSQAIEETLGKAAKRRKGLAGLAEVKAGKELQDAMHARGLDQVRLPGQVLRRSKLRYQLSEGIHIEGPWEAMKRRVNKKKVGNEWELTIRSQQCDETYHA